MREERLPGPSAWWIAPVALLVVVGSIGSNHGAGPGTQLWVLVTSAVAALSAPAATVRPRPALLLNGLAVGAYFGLGADNGPIFLAAPLAAFLASQATPPAALRLELAGSLLLVVAGLMARVLVHDSSSFVAIWQGVGVCALALAATAFGGWLQDRRLMRQERGQRAATEERLRMTRDLHDGVGHGLAVIAMHAGVALHLLDRAGDRFVMSEVTMPYRPIFPVFSSLVGWTFRYKRTWPVRGGDIYNGQSEIVLPSGKPCPK